MVGAVQTGAGGRGLRILDIGGCGIGKVGMLALCDGLIDHPTDVFPALETLVVGGNPGRGWGCLGGGSGEVEAGAFDVGRGMARSGRGRQPGSGSTKERTVGSV